MGTTIADSPLISILAEFIPIIIAGIVSLSMLAVIVFLVILLVKKKRTKK